MILACANARFFLAAYTTRTNVHKANKLALRAYKATEYKLNVNVNMAVLMESGVC
jgi:hypothetical protein